MEKEGKEYITVKLGLLTEEDCFKVIHNLGLVRYEMEAELKKAQDEKEPNFTVMERIVYSIQDVYNKQLQIINDVCERFDVVHPQIKSPTEYMKKHKTLYWDWYATLYKKVFGIDVSQQIIDPQKKEYQ